MKTPIALKAFARARALDDEGKFDEARSVLERALESAPDDSTLLFLRGSFAEREALVAGGDRALSAALAVAEEAYTACLVATAEEAMESTPHTPARDPNRASERSDAARGAEECAAATRLGTVHLLQGRVRDAADRFDQALELDPDHVEALLGRLEAEIFDGDPRWALIELETTLDERAPDGWILAALACWRLGLETDAATLAEKAMAHPRTKAPLAPHRAAMLTEIVSMLAQRDAAPGERDGAA